jgi:hypothetical protein
MLCHLLILDIFIVLYDDGFLRHREIAKSNDYHHREKQRLIVNEIVKHLLYPIKKSPYTGKGSLRRDQLM